MLSDRLLASISTIVLFSRDPLKAVHASKTAALKEYPANILHEEKHIHGIVLLLSKPNIGFKTTSIRKNLQIYNQ